MRTLVEQTARAVEEWFGKLAAEVDDEGLLPRPEDVHVLMGGVDGDGLAGQAGAPGRARGHPGHALEPGADARLRLVPGELANGVRPPARRRAVGVRRGAAHGSRRATSAQLEAFRQSDADRARHERHPTGSPARSLWISATLDPQWLATVDHPAPPPASVVRVDPAAAPDGRLARLSRAAKRLRRSPVSPASPKKPTRRLCRQARRSDPRRTQSWIDDARNRQSRGPGTSAPRSDQEGIVETARAGADPGPRPPLVHSRFRPADRQREMAKVGAADGNPHGRAPVAASDWQLTIRWIGPAREIRPHEKTEFGPSAQTTLSRPGMPGNRSPSRPLWP